jgi:nitrogen fixation NifU-like protein
MPRRAKNRRNVMASSWEIFEESIKAKMREVFSENVIEHSLNPRNIGDLEDADGFAKVTGSCGDTMEIWLKVKNGTISEASFTTDGCGTSVASGSMITEMAKGKSVGEAQRISQQDVLDALGGLPEESQHCALLAANTLKEAIKDYFALKREPWKRAYKKS